MWGCGVAGAGVAGAGAGGGPALGRRPRPAAAGGKRAANNPPYNAGAFRFELTFSPHHPLSPPCATLRTSIYHPGVDPQGRVCQPLTSPQHWVPTTRAVQVLQDLQLLLDSPDPRRALRQDLARELQDRPQDFWRQAEEHTRRHAEPRHGPPAL
ncbi:ubiquitin/ISG15-conjugating enzyme E2 L6 isoform X2 [Chroicocephalus ridibundus]|uniref:ubiquitin/ISG15-conjugating enzyme E2 L6 isoform X2 n=1 Tax=Chroicocephalus ridibundus TaxID=1192867 RepID=UPI002FDCC36F